MAQGSGLGGWTFYLHGGRPAYAHNFVSLEEQWVEADDPVPPGRHELTYRFERTGPHRGIGHLGVDGVEVARVDIPRFTLTKFSVTGAGLTCGYSDGLPVTRRYTAPFRFTGTLERLVVEVDGEPFADPEIAAQAAGPGRGASGGRVEEQGDMVRSSRAVRRPRGDGRRRPDGRGA